MPGTTDRRWVVPERGNRFAMWLALFLTRKIGRRRLEWLLGPITLYFFLHNGAARRASRAYLQRVLPAPPRTADMIRHMRSFAQIVLDRIFFLQNTKDMPPVRVVGRDRFLYALAAGRGCLLLGAHIGSFEALRALGREHGMTLRMLMYRSNLGGATDVLETLDPTYAQTIIPIGQVDTMLRVAESLGRGEIVGMLGDRTPDTGRCVCVTMLGGKVQLPEGPFRLALATGAPIVLVNAVRATDGVYDVSFDTFDVPYPTSRQERGGFVQQAAEYYAKWMEALCLRHPFSWFNFYDYWKDLP
ncbi:acyltransferase [Acetobacter sp. LMG 32666]|uniref:LpxL/LpxP family acyltransferase n=1 Tax=Acetobacter sp. LMG 32666 TaxID=2959295 RepID=UPI0030C7BC08